jgi:hypothetical protein
MDFYSFNANSIFAGIITAEVQPEMSTDIPVNPYQVGYYNVFTGSEWAETMYPEISNLKLKFALIQAGKLSAFELAANGLTDYERVYFACTSTFKRDDVYLQNIANEANISDHELDLIFQSAMTS